MPVRRVYSNKSLNPWAIRQQHQKLVSYLASLRFLAYRCRREKGLESQRGQVRAELPRLIAERVETPAPLKHKGGYLHYLQLFHRPKPSRLPISPSGIPLPQAITAWTCSRCHHHSHLIHPQGESKGTIMARVCDHHSTYFPSCIPAAHQILAHTVNLRQYVPVQSHILRWSQS